MIIFSISCCEKRRKGIKKIEIMQQNKKNKRISKNHDYTLKVQRLLPKESDTLIDF